jgi:hypothetical protein
VIDLLVGPLFYRTCVSHQAIDAGYVTKLVDSVLRAIA